MRKLMLGAVVCVAFGLATNGADAATASVNHPAKRLACHWVTADHTLRLLRQTLGPVDRIADAPANRPTRHLSAAATPAKNSIREPAVPTRAEFASIGRQLGQRISLMVGVGY
jgi:hypothetical protein